MKPSFLGLLALQMVSLGAYSATDHTYRDDVPPVHAGTSFEVLEDPSSDLMAEDVLASTEFIAVREAVPNLGISNSTFWLRCNLRNEGSYDRIFLCVEYAEIDIIEVFMYRHDKLERIALTGQSVGNPHRNSNDPEYSFTLPIANGEVSTVLVRAKSNKQLQLPIVFRSAQEVTSIRSTRNFLLGGYIGIMLVLSFYNIFIYFSIKDKSYLYYVLYLLAVALTQLAFIGIGQFYIWPGNIWLSSYATLALTLLTATLGMQFARTFIGTRTYTPLLDRATPIFFILFALCFVLQQTGHAILGYKLTQALSGLSAIYIVTIAILAVRRGSRQAMFFLVAWSAFLLSIVVFIFKDLGILPYNAFTTSAMPVGSAIEGILLSFGLADRINVLRREKAASQAAELRSSQENERIIREQNVTLENKVNERTHALQESNAHLKQTQTKLVNAEKMASLGQLTAGIAHEINNPINFITSNIQPLRRNIAEIVEVMQGYRSIEASKAKEQMAALKLREEELGISESINELDEIIGSMAEGSSRTAEIVRGLRNFSRLDEDDLKPTDLNEGIRSTLTLLGPQVKDHVTISLDLMELPAVECYPGKLNQVFMNVITNAIHATKSMKDDRKPLIQISSYCTSGHAIICIRDNGSGMNAEVKTRIFDPFFTTKPVGEGTGLGLAIVYGIIEDHHGSITVESEVGEGSVFTIQIPLLHEKLIQLRA